MQTSGFSFSRHVIERNFLKNLFVENISTPSSILET